ncbi:MAG TPA: hypothetical protein VNE41_00600 [Chitinophagaceae bacterium]|nr:hypothetical protein [Chitinophagaceae bacterium]
MRWLLFFSRVALLCNGCFAAGLALRYAGLAIPMNNGVIKTILILGFIAAIPANLLVALIALFLISSSRLALPLIPKWISLVNLGLLIIESVYWLLWFSR